MNQIHLQPILRAVNLSHDFEYPLLENIDFSLHGQQIVAIIGTSGSGKSTLLHILSTLLQPKSGNVIYNETDLYKLNNNELLQIRKNDFGIIFQSHYLFRGLSAKENIKLAELLKNTTLDENLIEQFQIRNVLSQNIGQLSGGQQQRISIARVLAKNPNIIFADEPTGNLDKQTAKDVMQTLFAYTKNGYSRAMMLVTHDEELAKSCDKIYKIENFTLKEIQ